MTDVSMYDIFLFAWLCWWWNKRCI